MNTQERVNWMLRNEHLWDKDLNEVREVMIKAETLSPKLSNWRFCIENLIRRCRQLKKIAERYQSTPVTPRSDIILTENNYDEMMSKREVIDIVIKMKHPIRSMDMDGYTYYDYAVYKRQQHKKPVKHVIDEINRYLAGGDINYLHDGNRKPIGTRFN